MRVRPVLAGAAAGAVLAAGGIAALDAMTADAEAQSGSRFATTAEVNAASKRASAAINMGKRVWNLYGIYGAEPNELVGAKSGPITQLRGIGGGLPESALASDVRAKLNDSTPGPQGPAGPAGPQGPAGPSGVSSVTVRTATDSRIGPGPLSVGVACEPGELATGGSAEAVNDDGGSGGDPFATPSSPAPGASGSTPTGWRSAIDVAAPAAITWTMTVRVVCMAS